MSGLHITHRVRVRCSELQCSARLPRCLLQFGAQFSTRLLKFRGILFVVRERPCDSGGVRFGCFLSKPWIRKRQILEVLDAVPYDLEPLRAYRTVNFHILPGIQ